MSITSGLAIFFITWWICLFVVLPWGVRNAHEEGIAVADGHDAGAPVNPGLRGKLIATTVLALIVFGLIYGVMTLGWITFEGIPFLGGMPDPVS